MVAKLHGYGYANTMKALARISSHPNGFELDIESLIPSFQVELTSLGRSPATHSAYLLGIRAYQKWLAVNDHPRVIDRRLVQAWIAHLVNSGLSANTAASRLAGLRQFSKWLAKEGEIPNDPLLGVNAPKAPIPLTPCLGEDELKALVKACQGTELRDRRDEALVRLLAETGLRAAECIGLHMTDVDIARGVVVVRHGKGNKARIVPFGTQTARALDRYIRNRRHHPAAEKTELWLAARNRSALTTAGLRLALGKRAKEAGISGFHPHVLRHTFASRWMGARGSENALMALAGWSDRTMLDRYGRAAAAARATNEARVLDLGNY